ncbi:MULTISPECIES: aldo/keto reductase [Streptomyces]|uniref:aldo/keto reductase n=1 Tax=Streptomyces TaxID=1883 RepID=UPI00069B3703
MGVVGLGCMGMTYAYDPAGRDENTSVAVLHRALDLGADLIDTADVYGPCTNEELVGRAFADQFPNGRRFGGEFLRLLREGPPWPTLDTVTRRLDGL